MAQLANDTRLALMKRRNASKIREAQPKDKKPHSKLTSKMTKIALEKHFGSNTSKRLILTDPDPPPTASHDKIQRTIFIKMLIIPLISFFGGVRIVVNFFLEALKNI